MIGVGVDVICVRHAGTTNLHSSQFLIKFESSESKQLYSSMLGVNQSADWRSSALSFSTIPPKLCEDDPSFQGLAHQINKIGKLDFYCNGILCSHIELELDLFDSKIYFIDKEGGKSTTPPESLLRRMNLRDGENMVRVYSNTFQTSAEFSIYLWNSTDDVAVFDIDGTLTKSDVRGYIETVYLSEYSYVHAGAAKFMTGLEAKQNLRFLYLTSRPLMHQSETKRFLEKCSQENNLLPHGPLITNKIPVMKVIYEEIFNKHISRFKANELQIVNALFRTAGRVPNSDKEGDDGCFIYGFGNRESDMRAYVAAGVQAHRSFLIDTSSKITIWAENSSYQKEVNLQDETELSDLSPDRIFDTYDDYRLVEYINIV